jgi:hypothetical protein
MSRCPSAMPKCSAMLPVASPRVREHAAHSNDHMPPRDRKALKKGTDRSIYADGPARNRRMSITGGPIGVDRAAVPFPATSLGERDHLLITAAPALLTTSSCESVPPEHPMAPTILPCSISGMPPRDAMTPSKASR